MSTDGYSMNSASDKPVRYLTTSDLYNINNEVTDNGAWVRDMHLLDSAARRPSISLFGEAQFPTILDKAAALLHSLAYHHLFIDGNKRTAVRAVTLFLDLNGYDVTWSHDTEYPYILEVAQGQHDVPEIAQWLAQFVRPAE